MEAVIYVETSILIVVKFMSFCADAREGVFLQVNQDIYTSD